MGNFYWNNWYAGWGWFLWYGLFFLFISSIGNWGYTYQSHRKYGGRFGKNALDILNERYARGEVKHDEYLVIRARISNDSSTTAMKTA